MKLIGAGYPRTGTLSTKVALEQLGFGPCYHFFTQFERPQDIDVWQAADEGRPVDWKGLLAGFGSTVDWPASLFYKQLMEVFPDAKVLLSVRDPEAWYESILNTVYTVSKGGLSAPEQSTHGRLGRMINSVAWQKLFHGRFEDKAYAISIFEQHNQEVRTTSRPTGCWCGTLRRAGNPYAAP